MLIAKGKRMQNCLRGGWYRIDAMLGNVAVFASLSRATLAVQLVVQATDTGLRVDR